MSAETILVWVLVGAVAGWLASKVVQGGGLGLIGDIVVGILGAFIGSWLLVRLGVHVGVGIIGTVITAVIGAIVLLLVIRLVRRI
jgi:uncharacterized membrane protein YeaQ/YmgE (transglycosylase-associated protein family)